jgi:hypothetical protein
MQTTYSSSVKLSSCECEQTLRGIVWTVTINDSQGVYVSDWYCPIGLYRCYSVAYLPLRSLPPRWILTLKFSNPDLMLEHSLQYFIPRLSNNFLLASFLCPWLFCGWHKTIVAFVWRYWQNKEIGKLFNLELFSHIVILIVTLMFVFEYYNT